jgi:hypothetical protein
MAFIRWGSKHAEDFRGLLAAEIWVVICLVFSVIAERRLRSTLAREFDSSNYPYPSMKQLKMSRWSGPNEEQLNTHAANAFLHLCYFMRRVDGENHLVRNRNCF